MIDIILIVLFDAYLTTVVECVPTTVVQYSIIVVVVDSF